MALMSQMAFFLREALEQPQAPRQGVLWRPRPKQGRESLLYEPPCPSPGQLPL